LPFSCQLSVFPATQFSFLVRGEERGEGKGKQKKEREGKGRREKGKKEKRRGRVNNFS